MRLQSLFFAVFLSFFALLHAADQPSMATVLKTNTAVEAELHAADHLAMATVFQKCVAAEADVAARPLAEQALKDFNDLWHWNLDVGKAGNLYRRMQFCAKELQLNFPRPELEEEVHRALHICNVTDTVTVLEGVVAPYYDGFSGFLPPNDSHLSRRWQCLDRLNLKRWQYGDAEKVIIMPSVINESLQSLFRRFCIFHECGHISAKDHKKIIWGTAVSTVASIGLGLYAGVRMSRLLSNFSLPLRICGGAMAYSATINVWKILYDKLMFPYFSRKTERNADIFACRKLISRHDYAPLLCSFVGMMESKDTNYWLFNLYPNCRERARIILDELKKANIDIRNFAQEVLVEKFQQNFIQQVKKDFPEY